MKQAMQQDNNFQEDDLDRRIVLATQSGLPVVAEPYRVIAEQLGISNELLMQRLETMKKDNRIRRIGVVPNHYKLGYTANGMSVWDVDDNIINEVGEQLGQLEMVTHCYQRPRFPPEWSYNLFAMVHGRDREEVLNKVAQIAELLGSKARKHDILFSTRILKKTGLRLKDRG
ncbi:MAG: Lrp/AsnC family transcriptional regulator [Gammaproteobacteria bacterium]|nr:Lrp/AsnC family transcriptional regulator [Gammaproteobacteria bacterium]